MNGNDIASLIRKGEILDISKEIPIKRTLTEDEPRRAESENESFKEMWSIQIENHVKRGKK